MINILIKFFNFCGKENKKKFYVSLIWGTIQALLEALRIPAIAIILSGILNNNLSVGAIWGSFLVLALSVVGTYFAKYKSTMLQTEAGYGTCADKRIEIAEHLRYLPMGYFNKNSLGYITSVTTNTMESLSDVATRVVMLTTQGFLTTALIAIMVVAFDWRIGIIVFAGILVFLLINSGLQRKSQKLSPKKSVSDSKLVEAILEYIQGIAEVKAYNLTKQSNKRVTKTIDDNDNINFKMEINFIPFMALQSFATKLTGVIMSMVSLWFYIQGTMDLLVCILMIISSFMIYTSLDSAGNYSALLRSVDVSVDKADDILNLPPMDIQGREYKPSNHDIDLENVSFSYDNRKIIDGVSLHLPEKTTTAIVGPSGGGKTTLCNLLARFWDVDGGIVKLGGIDVKDYSVDSLMKNFSMVFQNVYLFEDTIANNIRFGETDASMDRVINAAKKACCHDFIMALPNGYDTVIGEKGASLSGGEKQRISIARAIMKDAPVIILDEATANVDPENEKDLVDAIEALTREKTIIMIAHRLKTVRNADRILVVDDGKIVQDGRHEELMEEEGIYKRFINARELAVGWKI